MDERFIVTLYQKIKLSEKIMIFKRIGIIYNVCINFENDTEEVIYFDENRKRVILEPMDSIYTFVSDDMYCYGYPLPISTLKEMYPETTDTNELREKYKSDLSEVVNIAYYDEEKDRVRVFTTNEEIFKTIDEDELFREFTVSYDSSTEEENVTYSLQDFQKMAKFVREGEYEKLKEQILRISNSIVEINKSAYSSEETDSVSEPEEKKKEENIEEVLEKLNKLIGLENIKLEIDKLLKYLIFISKVEGKLNLQKPNLHMFFTGNPGTGKTTVARIIGELLYRMGYIQNNKVAEITPKDLIAGYIGQTAIKAADFIKKNRGGVIFIDEAYAFASDYQGYGEEALVEILKELEKNETVFIFAGYKDEMTKFMEMNPGLTSRIGYYLEYKDYTKEELYAIFESKVTAMGFKIDEKLKDKIMNNLETAIQNEHFGNGRYIDKLINKLILEHAINTEKYKRKKELITLVERDWNKELEETLIFKNKTRTKKIGF